MSETLVTPSREALIDVLAKHVVAEWREVVLATPTTGERYGCFCSCGEMLDASDIEGSHRAHVAASLPVVPAASLADAAARRVEREIRHLRAVPADVTTVPRDVEIADLEIAAQDIRALAAALEDR